MSKELKTNLDRIRAMSLEELSEFLNGYDIDDAGINFCSTNGCCPHAKECFELESRSECFYFSGKPVSEGHRVTWEDWLKQEWKDAPAGSGEPSEKDDLISRQAAIDALWKALYEYEDKTEKQFQESEDLDVGDWIEHRIFVQNMNDIDRQTILNLPSAQPVATDTNVGDNISRQQAIDAEDDLISRTAAINEARWVNTDGGRFEVVHIETLLTLPAIKTEHVGHWINDSGPLKCSECGTSFPDLYPDYEKSVACPHCGAPMRGERDV